MNNVEEFNTGITRIGIGDGFRPHCESIESSSLSSRICEFCGKYHDGSYGSGRFCSYSCKQKYTSIKATAASIKVRKEKRGIKCQCEYCGKNFDAKIDLKKHLSKCDKIPKYKSNKHGNWTCRYCNIKFTTRRELFSHRKICDKRDIAAAIDGYDSLGRVKNPLAYSHAHETLKRKYASGEITPKRHKHTDEVKKRISESRIRYLESHGNYGLRWFEIGGIKVQGTWEKRFAEYLLSRNIKFERFRIKFCRTHTYTPDFYCPDYNVYFEVKGFRRDRDIYKMYLVLDEHPEIHIKMIERAELENLDNIDIFSLLDFQEKYKREDIDISKFNNVWQS